MKEVPMNLLKKKINFSIKHIFLVLLIILFSGITIFGQNFFLFHQLTTEDNLTSQNVNYYLFKDSQNFIWISSSKGLNRFNGLSIKQYIPIKNDSTSIISAGILSHFYEDKNQDIWFSTVGGLNKYIRKKEEFEQLPVYKTGKQLEGFYYLLDFDSNKNEIWFRIDNNLYVLPKMDFNNPYLVGDFHMNINSLFYKNRDETKWLLTPIKKGIEFREIINYTEKNPVDTLLSEFTVRTIHINNEKEIWAGTDSGLVSYDIETKEFILYNQFNNQLIDKINSIVKFNQDLLLIGTQSNGLLYFDKEKNTFTSKIFEVDGLETKPFGNSIDKLYIDKSNTLWISTPGRGIFYTKLENKKIEAFLQNNGKGLVENNFIRAITEDENNQTWCLTRNGLSVVDTIGEILDFSRNYQGENVAFSGNYPFYITHDSNNKIWVGDFTGLYFLSPESEEFELASYRDLSNNTAIAFTVLQQLKNGKILTGSTKGVFKWDNKEKKLARIPKFSNEKDVFTWITQNSQSNQVLFRKIQNSFLIGHFQQDTFQLDTTINFKPFINYLHHDTLAQRYWLATSEGLHWIDYEGSQYELKEDTVLRYKTLMGVLRENDSDNLWLSSNRGIIKYNFKTGEQRVYGLVDGVQSLEFNFFASYKSKSGKLMFGGVNGLNIFDPKTIKDDAKPANPTITSILINDEPPKEKLICSETKNQNISYIEHLEFPHTQNTLSFYFAALDYVNPDANQFKYRMKGQDDKWVFSDTKNFTRYANLPPKSYVFEVDATNSDGVWSEKPAQLRITIHPPWYLTWYAYLGYFITGVCFLVGIYKFQINQRLKQAEAHRLKELDRIKTALYTNITHEFRTPLTIILGMADQIKDKPQKGFQQGLEMIRRSGQNLLNLVNQMLDLSKVESGNMRPQYVQGDIIHFLQYLVESFQSFANSKHITVIFYNEVPSLMMDYDTDKLQTILTNLLSNATKFTPEKGKIIVHVQEIKTAKAAATNFCQLKIKDDGIGIDEKDLPHIFDRFYQIDDSSTRHSGGTGIGLALTKELVELMEGTITVQSQLHKGTEFTILLPIRQKAAFAKVFSKEKLAEKLDSSAEEAILVKEEQSTATDNPTLPLVLIIEDNLDVITYLQACLEAQYRVRIALDGQAGIEKALELIPDIIITDVMMPLKDGYEVCEVLKAAEKTSHIPIIMLTAKAQIEAKIEGLSKGADAYLSKPFHQKELEVRLAQLLAQRKKLQAYYSQAFTTPYPKIEDPFIQKVIDLVEKDLAISLNVTQFSKALGMDRAQVFRKIKAMTGFSTSIFIRRIRLKNGHRLLLTTHLNIAEIAYSVGFKDPAYFSRLFSEMYKKSPKQLREDHSNG